MQPSTSDQIKKFNELFLLFHKSYRDATYAHSKTLGFTVPQITMIYELYNLPSLTLNELSKQMGLSKSTTSALVERMEKQGVVIRKIPKDNRRTVKISLSGEFISRHENLLALKDHIFSDLFRFENVNFADAENIISSVEKLNSLLRASIKELTDSTAE